MLKIVAAKLYLFVLTMEQVKLRVSTKNSNNNIHINWALISILEWKFSWNFHHKNN